MLPQKNTAVYANVSDVYLSTAQARTWISHPNNVVESNEVYAIFSMDVAAGRVNFRINYLRKYEDVT